MQKFTTFYQSLLGIQPYPIDYHLKTSIFYKNVQLSSTRKEGCMVKSSVPKPQAVHSALRY